MNKHLAIAKIVLDQAQAMVAIAKTFPNTGKCRNIFLKNYNRRPKNKQKRAIALTQLAITAAISVAQIHIVKVAPVPKYSAGGISNETKSEIASFD